MDLKPAALSGAGLSPQTEAFSETEAEATAALDGSRWRGWLLLFYSGKGKTDPGWFRGKSSLVIVAQSFGVGVLDHFLVFLVAAGKKLSKE